MNYLIDTCCISELVKRTPDAHVIQWFQDHDELSMYLSVLTFGELRKGIEKLPDSVKKAELSRWVQEDLAFRFRDRVIDISLPEVNRWGQILAAAEKAGTPLPAVDALIAASALVHDLTVVTRNIQDMKASQVEMVNPWRYQSGA